MHFFKIYMILVASLAACVVRANDPGVGTISLTIYGYDGLTYQLQRGAALAPANWQNIGPSQDDAGASLTFTGTGGLATSNYFLLTSTNISLPLSNWTRLAMNHFDLLGNFQMTSSVANGTPNQFYFIQVP